MSSRMPFLISVLGATAISGCAIMPMPEASVLKCGDVKDTKYEIPTKKQAIPVDVQFKMSCESGDKGVEVSIKNHPWGGVGKTMPRFVGPDAPNYEYIPCAIDGKMGGELKRKWDDFNEFKHFADMGRAIQDIRDVQIDMRFRQDYALRYYVLNSAKNICSAAPE